MPKRRDINKVMVIGSGPIVIGQAAEFDYAGTQACLALKEEGYEVILVNSNPATIMTDTHIADKVYMEPLTLEYVAKIIRFERPDAIVPGLGGQTGLNLAVQLAKKGILKECQVEILGTSFESIERAEDRELFKELCESLGEPVIESKIAMSVEEAVEVAAQIGYPVVLRPAYTLGGTGGGFVDNEEQLREMMRHALFLSPVHQVLVEKSIKGYKEIEFEVMRDHNDTAISICCMENIDPVGVHTGDSIVVAPCQTLTNKEFQMLRDSALKIIRELKIEGGCNVQFARDPLSFKYYLIEVNPRSSRTVPFLSKSTGVPMAHIATQVILGKTLKELGVTEVYGKEKKRWYVKAPAFSFAKIRGMDSYLSPEMKSTGEAIGYDDKLTRALYKALQATGMNVCNYGTIFVTIADHDKEQALPLVRRFYDLGFNVEATTGTAEFLREHGIRTRTRRKLSEGSSEIIDALRQGHVSYVINTIDINQHNTRLDGYEIRRTAVENNVTIFTALETVQVLLDVLEEITFGVSTIDAK